MTRRTGPARVRAVEEKRPPEVTLTGGEVTPGALTTLDDLLARGRLLMRDRDERSKA